MTGPFCAVVLVVCTGLSFLYQSPWPIFFGLGVLACNWKFWRNQ
jgi:uncharacterized membrane protein